MKIKATISFLIVITAALMSCQSNTKSSSKLELHNGEKWVIESDLMHTLMDLETHLHNFSGKTREDYNALGVSLQAKLLPIRSFDPIEPLVKDQLDKIVDPLSDHSISLEYSNSVATATHHVDKMKGYFETFRIYFR